MDRTNAHFSASRLKRRRRKRAPGVLTAQSVEVPAPLWASLTGLGVGVGFCGLAAASSSPFETVALLAGAAAAGGFGVYGLMERLARQRAAGEEWEPGGEARSLIDAVSEPMAAIDRFGRVVAANAAAARSGKAPSRAADLLGGAAKAEEIVYRLLGAALSGRPAEDVAEVAPGAIEAISVWPIGGGLALWRQTPVAAEGGAELSRAAAATRAADAPAMGGVAAEAAEIGWFRLDSVGRIIEQDRIFSRWLGARASAGPAALRTVLPEAASDGSGAAATRSRLIGAPGAPREVAVLIAPIGAKGESVGVAAAAGARLPAFDCAAPDRCGDGLGLFEAAPSAVLLLGADGRIQEANLAAERMFAALDSDGLPAGPYGDYLFDWIDEQDAERARRAFAAASRGGAGAETTLVATWAADAAPPSVAGAPPQREVEISFRLYAAAEGEPRRLAAFLQDASERLGLERNVAQAQKMQAVGVLAGGVAHDFNNMLAVIIGSCDMLMERKTADDPDVQELQMVLQSAQRAETLVRQLLAYSRKQHLEPTVANLTEMVSDISLMLNRGLSDRWFLHRDLTENLWPVMVDVHHLGHVIMNLVVNAKDAMPKGGKITVRTRNAEFDTPQYGPNFAMPPGAYVRLDVIDEGEGMPPEVKARIFEPFFTTKKVGKGTGLGLAMAYGIIKQSQGYLFVESEPGAGSSFSIYLPRCSEEAVRAHEEARRVAAERARIAASAPGKRSVLVVEDEAAVRSMAVTALRQRGYEVTEAADGTEALEILEDESNAIDLMLSDVVMPDMDGPSVLRALGDRRPEMRTVFMTGFARDSFAETLEDTFAERREFGVLQKPFRLPDLYQAVAEALGGD